MRVATARSTPTAFSGYAPAADSPDSISASARCRTTSAMSATWQQHAPAPLDHMQCMLVHPPATCMRLRHIQATCGACARSLLTTGDSSGAFNSSMPAIVSHSGAINLR
jgi:hypothetical protein